MPTIAHISDLHFGRDQPDVTKGLLEDLHALQPNLVVASGDFTQRARRAQFAAARDFMAKLPFPQLSVPGNHDIPLYDVIRRIFWPLHRYKKYICKDLAPVYQDESFVVMGVNTTRPSKWKDGRISLEEMNRIKSLFCGLPHALFKVLVTHHPFVPPPDDPMADLVDRGPEAMDVLDTCGADLLLAGHLHRHYHADARTHHVRIRRTILVAQAGTAISTRRRAGEPNAYHLITLIPPQVEIQIRTWSGHRFEPFTTARYVKVENHWVKKE